MADISQLSNADLLAALGQTAPQASLGAMSDADLMKAIGQPEVSTVGDVAKSAGIGLAKGVIGLAGLPGDAANLASQGYDYLTGSKTNSKVAPYADIIGSANIQKKIEGYTGQFYQPKTTAGQYAQTAGEFAPALLGGPESLAAKLASRVAAPAIASETAGQLTQGTSLEPYARLAGAVSGAGLVRAGSRAISPATIDADRAAALQGLAGQGVTDMSAGMKTGNKAIQYAQSENATAADTAKNLTMLQQLTGAVMRRAGVPEELNKGQAIPEVLAANRENLSNQFGELLGKHESIPVAGFNADAQKIVNEFKAATNSTEAPALQYFIDKVNQGAPVGQAEVSAWPKQYQNMVGQLRAQNVPDEMIAKTLGIDVPKATAGNAISGTAYQNIQSELGKALRSSYGTPGLTPALGALKDALDGSVANGLLSKGAGGDLKALQQLRGQWRDQNILEKAITNSGQYGAEHGVVTPSALYSAVNSTSAKRNAVALGTTPLAGLARDAKAVIGNITPPQSGTAPRLAAKVVPAMIAGGIGSLIGGPHVGLGAAGAMLAPIFASHTYGKTLMSAPVQRYLENQAAAGLRGNSLPNAALTSAILSLPSVSERRR